MTRQIINVQYPCLEHTESVANICIDETNISGENLEITINDAFSNKNNSMFIIINNTSADSLLTVKAGEAFPNSMLGNMIIEIPQGISAIQIQDLSRFEKSDGSIDIDFGMGFVGTVYAIAKWAGVRPVE